MNIQRLVNSIIIITCILVAILIGNVIVDINLSSFLTILGIILLIWTLFAGVYWWTLVPAAVAFGGFFYYGYRIYFRELALMLCLLPLFPLWLLRQREIRQSRPRLQWYFHVMAAFILIHCAYSIWRSPDGWGNILRVELETLWPFIFFYPFYLYGSTRVVGIAVGILYCLISLRWGIELYSYFDPSLNYLPGLNFVPSQGINALRDSSLSLSMLAFACLLKARSPVSKVLHFIVALLAAGGCLLGGGRSSLVSLLLLPIAWAIVFRRWWLLVISSLCCGILLVIVNDKPQMITSLPYEMQRSLSVLILSPGVLEVQKDVESSDVWHEKLRDYAFGGMVHHPLNGLIGNPVEAYNELIRARFVGPWDQFEYMVDAAARAGGYESGLATVLGIYGVVGVILYLLIFLDCFNGVLDQLRTSGQLNDAEVIYFIAFSELVYWIIRSWAAGGTPSLALMYAMIAKVLLVDRRKQIMGDANQGTEKAVA